ncbi:hypothetical protein AcW1_001683 [Taiwanofungus camphoratus]|nr:hypothetical protein AcV5_000273 [Antrodia cinnamomea]KAI0944854.1 hypothetical protein AcV7_001541 [Antrodia cinnamomea]KAI0945468.1 hypothetical protein AcW1_001683 [Antrodia cinnamomea]
MSSVPSRRFNLNTVIPLEPLVPAETHVTSPHDMNADLLWHDDVASDRDPTTCQNYCDDQRHESQDHLRTSSASFVHRAYGHHTMDYYGISAADATYDGRDPRFMLPGPSDFATLDAITHVGNRDLHPFAANPFLEMDRPQTYESESLSGGGIPLVAKQAQPELDVGGVQCQWGTSCTVAIHDTTPSGITRHLKEYHFDEATWDDRHRGGCEWCPGEPGSVPYKRKMFFASYGKHIASVHLRSTQARCPNCARKFGRLDSLRRHLKGSCRAREA